MTTAQLKTLASEIQDATYLLAIKLSKAIVNLDATDARFYGSKDAYDRLTRYAQRVLRIEADRNNSEINSLATVTAVSLAKEKPTEKEVEAALVSVMDALAGITAVQKRPDADFVLSQPEFKKLVSAMLEKVVYSHRFTTDAERTLQKEISQSIDSYVQKFAVNLVIDRLGLQSTDGEIYNGIVAIFARLVNGVELKSLTEIKR